MLLVTGGTGFLGQNLVKSLSRKRKVAVLARDPKKAKSILPKGVRIIKGDILEPKTLKPLEKAKTIFHLAGMVSYSKPKKELLKANLEGTQNVLNACRKPRFIFSGSVGAMGSIRGIADENYQCKPSTSYGTSKLLAERAVLESGMPAVSLRLAPVYGKGSPSWIKNLKMLEKGFPIPDIKTLTHVLHVSNAVQAFEKSLKKGKGIYLVADKEPMPFTDFASKLMELLGKEPKLANPWIVNFLATVTGKALYLKVLTMNRHYNISKAKKDLGYSPKPGFEKKVREMVKWYNSLGSV